MATLSKLEAAVLAAFVRAARAGSRSGQLSEAEFQKLREGGVEPAVARPVLTDLAFKGLLQARSPDPIEPNYEALGVSPFSLSATRALQQESRQRAASLPKVWSLTARGAELWFEQCGAVEPLASDGVPAGQEPHAWQPLPLEQDAALLDAAASSTERLLERVRGENGFAVSDPVRHQAVLWSLGAGLEALKRRLPSAAQVHALLLQPMRWLAEHFGKAAIGEMAKEAAKAVLRAIGWTQ